MNIIIIIVFIGIFIVLQNFVFPANQKPGSGKEFTESDSELRTINKATPPLSRHSSRADENFKKNKNPSTNIHMAYFLAALACLGVWVVGALAIAFLKLNHENFFIMGALALSGMAAGKVVFGYLKDKNAGPQ